MPKRDVPDWRRFARQPAETTEVAHLPSFQAELERQCNAVLLPPLLLAVVVWLPYIYVHQAVFPDEIGLVINDLGLTLWSLLLLALRMTPFFRRRGYLLLTLLVGWLMLGSAITAGLVRADSSYLTGYVMTLYLLPLLPFQRRHTFRIFALSLAGFVISCFVNGASFDTAKGLFDLLNLVVMIVVIVLVTVLLDRVRRHSYAVSDQLAREKHKSDELLDSILPAAVAKELKDTGVVEPVHFDEVTVLFTDFVGFTSLAEKMPPGEVTATLDRYFDAFDTLVDEHGIEKLKTIGDAYMCAGGLPQTNATHAVDCVLAALAMRTLAHAEDSPGWQLRIGIHTGPVVAGVIGHKKFAYDIWGDTVNIASRLESAGIAGEINISGETFARVEEFFVCEPRGWIAVKNRGELEMFLVKRIKPELSADADGLVPNQRFEEIYAAS